jgi:hypothetical protein
MLVKKEAGLLSGSGSKPKLVPPGVYFDCIYSVLMCDGYEVANSGFKANRANEKLIADPDGNRETKPPIDLFDSADNRLALRAGAPVHAAPSTT